MTSLLGLFLVGALAVPGVAAPTTSTGPSTSSSSAAPSVDPAAPTPSTPKLNGALQGHGPNGDTIGGEELSTRGTITYDGAPGLPKDINAHGFLVADVDTGQVLAAQDPHGRYYPASTLKTLTMLALYPHLDPKKVLTATYEDASVEGSRVGVVEDGKYTVAQLWSALMLQSGNDAARMLTTAVGGKDTALDLMNDKALSLHAHDTTAGSTSGLDVAGQASSPYDLALFMREIIADPTLRKIVSAPTGTLPAQPPKYPDPMTFGNQNQLLLEYPGAIAGKNGFTDAARHTFVCAAERDGRTLVVSLMQAEQTPVPTWQQAAALLDWGFAAPESASGAGRLVTPDEVVTKPMTATESAAPSSSPATATNRTTPLAGFDTSDHELSIWPLVVMLGGLLAIAVRIAAPRHARRRR